LTTTGLLKAFKCKDRSLSMNNWEDLTEYLVTCRKTILGWPTAIPENEAMVEFDTYNTRRETVIRTVKE